MTGGAAAGAAALLDEIQAAIFGNRERVPHRELEMVGLLVRIG